MTVWDTEPEGVENISLVGGALCLDFTNTRSNVDRDTAPDELVSFDHWLTWAERTGAIDGVEAKRLRTEATRDRAGADRAFAEVKAVRDVLFRIFRRVAEDAQPGGKHLDALRDAWQVALGHARLAAEDDRFGWVWPSDGDDLSRPLWPVIASAVELLSSDRLSRVRFCGGQDCSWLFVDQSKNGRRRWCQMDVCGNREKARRHYQKKKAEAVP